MTRYLWTRQTMCPSGLSYDPRDQGSRTSFKGSWTGKKQACSRHSARSKRSMAGGAIERKEITLSSRRRCLSRLMRWRSWAWRRRNTKVAAKLGTESVEKVVEKADMAALQLCKEKESIATWPGCSTELKKWSNCRSKS